MKFLRVFLLCVAAASLAFVPACKRTSDKVRIAIVTNNPEDFWAICRAGATKAEKEFDVELIFRMPEKGEVGLQMNIVKDLVNQNVHGIAVSVLDPKEQSAELKVIAGKTKLIAMDNDAEDSNRICYIGTDNYAAGRAAGRLVKEVLPEGEVAILVGNTTSLNAQQRFQGVVDELAGQTKAQGTKETHRGREVRRYGKYLLYKGEVLTDDANREKSLANAKLAIEDMGDREDVCLVGLYAYNPPTILQALGNRTKPKVVAFDEDGDTLTAIDQGRIHGTIVQDPFNFGYKSVEILAAEARGDQSKRNVKPIPYRVITKNGGETKTIDGVEVKNLKATVFRDELKTLIESAKAK